MTTLRIGGQLLSVELLEELKNFSQQPAPPSRTALAKQLCEQLGWFKADGDAHLTKARDLLRKLDKGGHLKLPPARGPRAGQPRRLASRGEPLPALGPVPGRVDQIVGLYLHELSGWED